MSANGSSGTNVTGGGALNRICTSSSDDTGTTNDSVATAAEQGADPLDVREPHDFVALYQLWYRRVHRWIGRLGGPGLDADDLTQEVFLVVHRKLDRFDGVNLAGWLYRIAQLTVRDYRQRAWFRNIFMRSRDAVVDEVASAAAAQDERLDGKQREMCICRLIAQLNPKWRDSFLLFEVAGLTGQEIASLQGIPAATVRTHLSRARKEIVDLAAQLPADEG
jgi:RNA polymerase sigma-70 factor (ECF subfamily)